MFCLGTYRKNMIKEKTVLFNNFLRTDIDTSVSSGQVYIQSKDIFTYITILNMFFCDSLK
jgi:hypothetical protein